jgi:hypothetical protein
MDVVEDGEADVAGGAGTDAVVAVICVAGESG